MKIRPTAMTLEELRAWEKGQEQLLCELWDVIEQLENSCNDTGYGMAQKRMLRLVVQMMIDGACDR
jgi:hypothetical protein